MLFAVTLAAIFLSIALGVSQIAYKESIFGTSAKDTNNAFFAADAGEECALYYDRSDQNVFTPTGSSSISSCAGSSNIPVTPGPTNVWTFVVPGLGSTGTGCASVTVDKTGTNILCASSPTCIFSKGYNTGSGGVGSGTCNPPANAVERELDTNY